MTRVFFAATSYPRSETDWQGIFIRRIADALAECPDLELRMWAPEGPRHGHIRSALSPGDSRFLDRLTTQGGIAHLLRNHPAFGTLRGAELVGRLHRAYRRNQPWADVFHLNWLQCAIGQVGLRKPVLATVLGSDLALLQKRGIRQALRLALRHRRVILCPNAPWMMQTLEREMQGICEDVVCVPFGLDDAWFNLRREPEPGRCVWISVLRVTEAKIGPLFEWTRALDPARHEFHLFGPRQDELNIPPWIHYHGPATPQSLARDWYPRATGMISLSQHSEGRPQVLLEAMASGVPVICSAIDAHADLIEHDSTGILVSTQDEFQNALERIKVAGFAEQMASRARAMVRNDCGTWGDCAARYAAVYDRLMSGS